MSTEAEAALGAEIAAKAQEVGGVAGLSSGSFGTVATPLPGGWIEGVALREDSVQVGVIVRYGHPIPGVAERLHEALEPLVPGRAVHVSVEDIVPEQDSGVRRSPLPSARRAAPDEHRNG